MEGFRDRADDALRKAGAPALQRIAADAAIEGLPNQLRRLLKTLHEHLFEPQLTVGWWRKKAGVGDTAVGAEFEAWLGVTMKEYVSTLRLETGARMLAATDLHERRISRALGFSGHRTFWNLYKTWYGKIPGDGRDRPAPWLGPSRMRRASSGELTAEELDRFVAELHRLHPHLRREPRGASEAPEVRVVVDGGDYERFEADRIWRQVRTLPFDEQKRRLRGYLFRSTALFDLLRKTSREEGRKDRERGVQVARLALASLDDHDEVFGGRIHDLRALGWACVANARRLILDFDGAEADLARSDGEWSTPRGMTDLEILAEILQVKSALRICQRRFPEAHEKVDESIRLSRLTGETVFEAQGLVLRASVNIYLEHLRESVADLRSATAVIEGGDEPFLALKISLVEANTYLRLGDRDSAQESLTRSAVWCRKVDYPLGWHEIQHLEGALSELAGDATSAEKSYLEALDGFLRADEPFLAVSVALDLRRLGTSWPSCLRC